MTSIRVGLIVLISLVAGCTAHPAVSSSSSSSGSYSSAGPGAMAFAGNFGFPGAFARSAAGPIGSYAGFDDQGGFFFPQQYPQPDFNSVYQQFLAAQQAQFAFPNQFPGNEGPGAGYAGSSASLGSQGGYGQASVSTDNGLGLRIGEFSSPPSGGNGGTFGTFSSSSSGMSDVNGRRTSFKQASVGVNDNGKIYFKTVSDPQ